MAERESIPKPFYKSTAVEIPTEVAMNQLERLIQMRARGEVDEDSMSYVDHAIAQRASLLVSNRVNHSSSRLVSPEIEYKNKASGLEGLVSIYQKRRKHWNQWQSQVLESSIIAYSLDLADQGAGAIVFDLLGHLNPEATKKGENGEDNSYLRDLKGDMHVLLRMRRDILVKEETHARIYRQVRQKFDIFFHTPQLRLQ